MPVRTRPRLELPDLQAFVATVEEGSFRAAAHRLFLTQPSVSVRIRNLERHTGELLDRRRDCALTEAGARLYPVARAMCEMAECLPAVARGEMAPAMALEASAQAVLSAALLAQFQRVHEAVDGLRECVRAILLAP